MASPQDSHRSVEFPRVCTSLQKVHQRVFCDGITPDKTHIEEHSLQVGQECQEVFEKLKTAVTTAPVLQIFQPDKAEELEVHTDAS